jgi:uncharacterized protein (DUF885 family)
MNFRTRIAALLLFSSFFICFLTGCSQSATADVPEGGGTQNPVESTASTEESAAFTKFTNDIFTAQAAADPLTLNYSLAHPENYGIQTLPDGFSTFTYKDLADDSLALENTLSALESFDRSKLSDEQQRLADVLEDTLNVRIQGQTFLAFTENLGPTTGIQAQLPVLLAEFRIEDEDDLSQYFSLLRTIPDYFDSLLSIEKEKRQLGTLPCKTTLSHIINQCEGWLGENGTALLTDSLRTRLASCSFLSAKERTKAQKKNKRLIEKCVIPAYQNLLSGLTELIPSAPDSGALCGYSRGKSYYEYLVRAQTGSSRPVTELQSLLQERLDSAENTLLSYAKKNPGLFTTCQDYAGKFTSPEQILSTLKDAVAGDFPTCKGISYSVKYVDESLEDYLSPAFYLTPPMDEYENNVIYINGASRYDSSSLFNTLAHEGYPGHLLQTCYMQSRNLPLLRYALDCGGYTEGWASYAEIYSYKYTGAEDGEVAILQNNMIATLCLYGLTDIGIHYEGWDKTALQNFLKKYGTWDETTVTSLYEAVVDEPASYLKYAAGYLEFALLRDLYREKTGDADSDKAFHTFVLDAGSAPFSVLQKWLEAL